MKFDYQSAGDSRSMPLIAKQQMTALARVFKEYDGDGSGAVDSQEFEAALTKVYKSYYILFLFS